MYLAHKVRDLRRHLRRAVVDHVSDAYIDTTAPMMVLVENAKTRNRPATENAATEFFSHTERLIQVSKPK